MSRPSLQSRAFTIQIVLICEAYAVLEFGVVGPAQGCGLADVQQLAGSAVRAGGIPLYAPLVAYHLRHQGGQVLDADFLARACVHRFVAAVVVHKEHAELGEVVDIKEFAERGTISPAGHARRSGYLRFVEAADEGGQHVAVFGVVVVVGPVEVGGHD